MYAKEHNAEHSKFDLHTVLDIALLMYLLLLVQWYSFYLVLPRVAYLSIKRMHFLPKSMRHFFFIVVTAYTVAEKVIVKEFSYKLIT